MAINMSEVFYDWYSVEAKGTWDRSTQTLRAFISKIIVRIEAAAAARGAGRRSAGTPNNTLHPALVFFLDRGNGGHAVPATQFNRVVLGCSALWPIGILLALMASFIYCHAPLKAYLYRR